MENRDVPVNEASGPNEDVERLAFLRHVDRISDLFEAELRLDKRPRIEDYLRDTSGEERLALLRELLQVEIDYRLELRETPRMPDYLSRFPEQEELLAQVLGGVSTVASCSLPASEEGAAMRQAASELPEFAYEILGELGHGGMGVVHQARDLALNRIVALKTVRRAEQSFPQEQIALFLAEAQAVALLKHPLVVQIYAWGNHAGQPYFVMEYVEGGSLEKRLQEDPQLPNSKEAARLVMLVARAVHMAHQKGIVHRDLKPANVLLAPAADEPALNTVYGVPKVSDFGLVWHLNAAAEQAASPSVAGTPSYWAPEQAAGLTDQIGPATDVYALGGILYRMLTGRAPFRGRTPRETCDRIQTSTPRAPTLLRPACPRALEVICLKCLQNDPAKRYQTAEDLADDLKRFLDRARRRRLWAAVGGFGVVLTLILIVLAATRWSLHRSQQQAREAFDVARASLRPTLAALDDLSLRDPMKGLPIQKDLELKVPMYEQYLRQQPTDSEVRAELGMIYSRLGWVSTLSASNAKAIEYLQKALQTFAEITDADPGAADARSEQANAWCDLGLLFLFENRPDEAEAAYNEAIGMHQRLVKDVADDRRHIRHLALAWEGLGDFLEARGDSRRAADAFLQAITIHRALTAPPNDAGDDASILAGLLGRRGAALIALGRTAAKGASFRTEADACFAEALALLDKTITATLINRPLLENTTSRSFTSAHGWGTGLGALLHKRTGSEVLRKMVAFYREPSNQPGKEITRQRRFARSNYYLAMTLVSEGEQPTDGAADAVRRSVTAYEELSRNDPENSARHTIEAGQVCVLFGGRLFLRGRIPDGSLWFQKGVEILEPVVAREPKESEVRSFLALTHFAVAACFMAQNDYLDAITHCQRVFELDESRRRGVEQQLYIGAVAGARRQIIISLRANRHEEALKNADALCRIPEIPGEALYDAASAYAVAAEKTLDLKMQEQYAARAVVLLGKAFATGFGKFPINKGGDFQGKPPLNYMQDDSDLATLRDRADYQRLLEDLKKKG
jgi:serine/threonine protein kinase